MAKKIAPKKKATPKAAVKAKAPSTKTKASAAVAKGGKKTSTKSIATPAKTVDLKKKTTAAVPSKPNLASARNIKKDLSNSVTKPEPSDKKINIKVKGEKTAAQSAAKGKEGSPLVSSKSNHAVNTGGEAFSQVLLQLSKLDRSQMTEEQVKWSEYVKKYGKMQPREYKMTEQYEANMPILHKTLGWGYVVSNEFDRLEVVFESGKKMLISNYKSNS